MNEERPIAAGKCCRCGCRIWLTPTHYFAAMEGRSRITFHCGYGHPQHFCDEDDEITKMRRERDRLKQQMAERDDRIQRLIKLANDAEATTRKVKAEKAKLTKRASAGTCPVCNRTFSQMARHMQTQHKEFVCEAAATTQRW
jgi:hypothetical protein